MKTKPRVLDLFCGAGGASMGYYMAGFDVVGVDNKAHKDYPFPMIIQDALELTPAYLQKFDLVHASPPCQPFTSLMKLAQAQGKTTNKPDLLEPTRHLLRASGVHYIIENVVGAPLINPVQLCGSSFGLEVRRHRLFESFLKLEGSKCDHKTQGKPIGVYGSMGDQLQGKNNKTGGYVYGGRTANTVEEARHAMGIGWNMKWSDLVEAIPPAYTEYLGLQAKDQL
jgi:DNA (cytosine-5)-methyltransferase 1